MTRNGSSLSPNALDHRPLQTAHTADNAAAHGSDGSGRPLPRRFHRSTAENLLLFNRLEPRSLSWTGFSHPYTPSSCIGWISRPLSNQQNFRHVDLIKRGLAARSSRRNASFGLGGPLLATLDAPAQDDDRTFYQLKGKPCSLPLVVDTSRTLAGPEIHPHRGVRLRLGPPCAVPVSTSLHRKYERHTLARGNQFDKLRCCWCTVLNAAAFQIPPASSGRLASAD